MTRILAALVLALLGYEAATLSNATPGDTISEVVWALSDNYGGIVGLLFGIVVSHFFWPRKVTSAPAPSILPFAAAAPRGVFGDRDTLLQSGLAFVQQIEVPKGKSGIAAVVADDQGLVAGIAVLTRDGQFEWKGAAAATFGDIKSLRIIGSVAWD